MNIIEGSLKIFKTGKSSSPLVAGFVFVKIIFWKFDMFLKNFFVLQAVDGVARSKRDALDTSTKPSTPLQSPFFAIWKSSRNTFCTF